MVHQITHYTQETKNRAEKLRQHGLSYKQIYNHLKIPKSTLSTWFGSKYSGVFDKEKQTQHLVKIRVLALEANRKKREKELNSIKFSISNEIKTYPLQEPGFLKSILAALYWAEGGKYNGSPVNFANTDPKLSNLFINLLRKCYRIDEGKIRIRLHLHYYHNITKTRQFWSELLDVPINQFGKIYIKKRSQTKKFRKNFMGICFLYYPDSNIRKEIIEISKNLAEMKI